ncbi:helix-turn-helix domain-containing protein [Inquilinus sp. CA228]|uniref:helix-turn-helix domain-containing protein n=1 Tax=Inquilinus sp. CA228 TaxID=3455609 RepID=UPI003F8D32C8
MDRKVQQDSHRPTVRPHPFSSLDILSIPAKERFDYWRTQFMAVLVDRDRSEWANDFRGKMLRAADHNGIAFTNLHANPMICTFGKRGSDIITLVTVHQGVLHYRHGNDDTAILDARSGLMLFDSDRPAISSVSSATSHDLSYLALPRSVVTAAMGGDAVPRGQAMRFLPNHGLSPILQAHLNTMASHGEHLPPAESMAAMRAASDMALTLLSRLNPRGVADGEALDDAVFTATRRYIEANLGHYDLTADRIAAGVGCSRARLYRIFAQRDQTVGDCLREARLRRASQLLETLSNEPIAMIAFDCGYTDLSAFGKAFKRQFGVPPGDWRVARADARRIA